MSAGRGRGCFGSLGHHSPTRSTPRRSVRDAQLAQYNFVLVVGSDEAADRAVNVRTRANEVLGKKSLVDALAYTSSSSSQSSSSGAVSGDHAFESSRTGWHFQVAFSKQSV